MPRCAWTRVLSPLALAWLATGGAGCLSPIQLEPEGYEYRAVIRWTSHGIPHILADDLPSAAYGQGYAFARLNGCILADQVLKIRSERAMFLGPGEDEEHVRSDLVLKALRIYQNAEQGLPELPEDIRTLLVAYAAGYNDFVLERGSELPCAEQPWLRPISPTDLLAYYIELGMLASSRQAHEFYWAARPPGSAEQQLEEPRGSLSDLRTHRPGSNGWGIGRERSANGHGMLVANPHFPWQGELKLFESHLRVPGQLDVYGASLMGVVGVLIGFNEDVAWTHTVSDGQRLVVYSLTLDPDDPLRYMHDGESKPMTAETFEVQVLQDDGETLAPVSRTFYRSHHGLIVALPPLLWSRQQAFAIRDANANNQAMIPQFIGMNLAGSMDEFQQVHDQQQGIPWVNTISTSRDGRAWYVDSTPTANLRPEAIEYWLEARETDIITGLVDDNGLVLLPGDSSTFDWVEDPAARDPGLIPVTDVPRLERSDFVFNANDSHWLTNPFEPLTGYSPLHGFERTPRSPRTRMNARTLLDEDGLFSGSDHRFDLVELRDAILSNRGMLEELLRNAVVDRCAGVITVPLELGDSGEVTEVDVSAACERLAAWDGRLDTDSVGALVWREFLGGFTTAELTDKGVLFSEAFDPADPVFTPRGLSASDRVLEALAGAVLGLERAGLPLDTPLGQAQYTVRAGERIPIHGGVAAEGVTNLIVYGGLSTTLGEPLDRGTLIDPDSGTGLSDRGYVVNYGSSFVMAMQFTDEDPEAYALLTYGQSDDPRSPYHTDQTHRFSDKDWRTVLWTEEDIETDPELEVQVLFGFDREP